MNISQILVDGVPVKELSREDLLDPKKLITFINADAPQPIDKVTSGGFKRDELVVFTASDDKPKTKINRRREGFQDEKG